jgi:hypothetical protein
MTRTSSRQASLDSTTLASASYDGRHARLELEFRDGTRYLYSGVAPNVYRELLGATSKGSFFNRYIRNRFPYAKMAHEY